MIFGWPLTFDRMPYAPYFKQDFLLGFMTRERKSKKGLYKKYYRFLIRHVALTYSNWRFNCLVGKTWSNTVAGWAGARIGEAFVPPKCIATRGPCLKHKRPHNAINGHSLIRNKHSPKRCWIRCLTNGNNVYWEMAILRHSPISRFIKPSHY